MKKKLITRIRKLISLAMLLAVGNITIAQKSEQRFFEQVAKPITTKGWIDFKESNSLNPQTLFLEHPEMFGLTALDHMEQIRMKTDEIGYTHFRFQQYHKGLKIIGAETILHYNGSYLKSMNGYIAEKIKINFDPKISAEIAFITAKNSINAENFIWELETEATSLKEFIKDEKDLQKPTGELVICRKDWNGTFTNENLTLAYIFRMIALPMHESKEVYIDATSGEIIVQLPLTTNCNNNTGNTTWFGSQNFNAGFYGFPNNAWLLESHCPGEATMRSLRGDPLLLYNYGDADGIWTDADGVNGYNQRAGVTTYYGVHKSYDYFKNTHSRLSYDGSNGQLDAFSEITGGLWLPDAENASWNTVTHHFSFGAGLTSSATDDWNTLDIVGHEFTHGVHQWSIGNNYNAEPGALDESFADIFGECIEAFAKGTTLPDWTMGTDRAAPIRNLSNPNANFQPDTYMGTFWQPTSDPFDNAGVHTNSGVQNHWFYLLVMGGSGTNDNGEVYNVSGIGLNAARDITYRNMDLYLTTASGYIDSREGSLRAAEDLYGWCSNNMLQVGKAWYAVGVATADPDWNKVMSCGNLVNGTFYRGINSLSTNNSCTTTLLANQSAAFTSGPAGITLKPGFTAVQSCLFSAFIDVCNEAAYNLRTTPTASNATKETVLEQKVAVKIDRIYPNPATNLININFQSQQPLSETTFQVSDISGRIIHLTPTSISEVGEFKIATLNIQSLHAGIYVIMIRSADGNALSKFIVSN
jgi:bacillolysin